MLIVGCNNDKSADKLLESESDALAKDTVSSKILEDIKSPEKKKNTKELQENLKQIEKKYGEQWGFCECVVANDSINTAIMNTTDFEGPKFDKLMKRSDFVTNKCQAFLSLDANKTPAERASHERKVKKCLSESKKP